MYNFLKNKFNTNPRLIRTQINATGYRSTVNFSLRQEHTTCYKCHAEYRILNRWCTNSESDWICFEMFSPTWLIIFHRNTFYAQEINGNLCVYVGYFTFYFFAHDWCVTSVWSRGNSRLNKDQLSSTGRTHWKKKDTDLFGHGYTTDVQNSPVSSGMTVCNRNAALKQHHMIEVSSSPGRWHQSSVESQFVSTWWRHQMEIFSALLAICAGNSPVTSEFPVQGSVTRSFDVFFDLRLYKLLSKQS